MHYASLLFYKVEHLIIEIIIFNNNSNKIINDGKRKHFS